MTEEDIDYMMKRAWSTFTFEFKKITDEMQAKTEKLFMKIFNEVLKLKLK